MTNATIQKVCYLTLNSTSGSHRHTLGGRHGAIGVAYVIFIASAAHGEFQKCIPLVISVCTLVSHMAAFEVLVVWEYELH
jgi:hypothetical protein